MNASVEKHDQPVTRIEDSTADSASNTNKGVNHLSEAVKTVRATRRKKWYCFWLVVLIILLVVAAVLIW